MQSCVGNKEDREEVSRCRGALKVAVEVFKKDGEDLGHPPARSSCMARKSAPLGYRLTILVPFVLASLPHLGRTEQTADKAGDSALVAMGLWQNLPAEPQRYNFEHYKFLFFFALIGCCSVGGVIGFACGLCSRVMQRVVAIGDGKSIRQKHKQTQSQTTYTWRALTPRFTPVHEYAHGGWDV